MIQKYSYLLHVHVRVKDLGYVKINSVNPLCLIINKINEYIEESREINI